MSVTLLPEQMFIGTACDHDFARYTAVMLTSLDANGGVPEAGVLIAGFDLTDDDRRMIRAGAGRLGERLRFIDVDRAQMAGIALDRFSTDYPPPVLGRLFLPDQIAVRGGRLLTLDSDMIVNASVRPLFELELGKAILAAMHDLPRSYDPDYFNTGLMLIDVDLYKHYDIAACSLRWLADQPIQPTFPDQDALNHAVGERWHRIGREWNYFYMEGEPEATPAMFDQPHIAHFAGVKPWNEEGHAGRPLYDRYLAMLEQHVAAERSTASAGSSAPAPRLSWLRRIFGAR